jgi:polysaccharide pyruvyl transferase WcaK-like protein
MSEAPAATLIGYYHAANLGDDVFCVQFAQALRRRGYERLYLPNTRPALRRLVGAEANIGTRASIDRSQLVVLGGGGALGHGVPGPAEHHAFSYYWRVAWYCRLRRRPLHLLGIGAGPWSTARSRRAARQIAQLATSVIVRDEASREALAGLSPRLAERVWVLGDPAMALDESTLPALPPLGLPRPCLGVNLCAVSCFRDGIPPDEANPEVIQAVQALLREGRVASVLWFSTAPGTGELMWAARGVQATGRAGTVAFYDADPLAAVARLRECDAFLSMKLHSGVLAASVGASVIGLGSHPKAERFYRAVGAEDAYRGLGQLRPGQVEPWVRAVFPGAVGLRDTSRWQALRASAQRVFDTIPSAGLSTAAAPAWQEATAR